MSTIAENVTQAKTRAKHQLETKQQQKVNAINELLSLPETQIAITEKIQAIIMDKLGKQKQPWLDPADIKQTIYPILTAKFDDVLERKDLDKVKLFEHSAVKQLLIENNILLSSWKFPSQEPDYPNVHQIKNSEQFNKLSQHHLIRNHRKFLMEYPIPDLFWSIAFSFPIGFFVWVVMEIVHDQIPNIISNSVITIASIIWLSAAIILFLTGLYLATLAYRWNKLFENF